MTASIPISLKRRIRERFANCCAYCRTAENLTATTFEFEHIVPRSAGGASVFANVCFSCPMCNRYKSNRTLGRIESTEMECRLFHPHQDHWTDHFSWNEDSTEIVALTDVGQATITALKMNRPQIIRVRRMWVAMNEHPPILED
jgi:hypothetical protein